ncbi:MAG: hypothetical protein NT166_08605 [Candidatus Aminicenantes bacterium]|nr:hypothetical protein [Candidatus Aminicenantes bacterium]
MKIKTHNIFFAAVCISIIIAFSPALAARAHYSFYLNGPSISKHFDPYHRQFKDFHPGIGGEFYFYSGRLLWGFHGHFMIKDSRNNSAYWTGFVVGWSLGNKNKMWFEPFIIIGGIKKNEYNGGKFGPFALPVLSVGYKRIGFNLCYIPKLRRVTYPILLVQIKVRLV